MAEGYASPTCDVKLRTIVMDVPQADGSIASVSMQVVNVRDANGDPLGNDRDLLRGIFNSLNALCRMYSQATGQAVPVGDDQFT